MVIVFRDWSRPLVTSTIVTLSMVIVCAPTSNRRCQQAGGQHAYSHVHPLLPASTVVRAPVTFIEL